jgi:hypothetical protein
MIADFVITVHDDVNRSVRVIVHNSTKALRSAATRYDRARGYSKLDNTHVLGLCHRFNMENDPLCAVVRLAPPYTGIDILSHEMAHAAVWIHELINHFKTPLDCSNDEMFCWILGELVRQTVDKMYEHGVY